MRIIVKWVMLSVCRRSNERIIIMSECRAFVPNVHVLSSQDDIGDRVARMVLHDAECAIVARDRFVVAFSGGSLPSIVWSKDRIDIDPWLILSLVHICSNCKVISRNGGFYLLMSDVFLIMILIPIMDCYIKSFLRRLSSLISTLSKSIRILSN
jgi:hypothetical protein